MSTALRFSELSESVNLLSSQLLKAASNASEAISLRERALASAEERVSDLTIALQKADSVIIELSSRVVSLQHERQNFAARAAKLRVEFEREMRAVELDAASYARVKRENEVTQQQLGESSEQLALVSRSLAQTQTALATLQRQLESQRCIAGERYFLSLPRPVLSLVVSFCSPALSSSLALVSRAMHAKMAPVFALEPRRQSDGGFSDTLSVASAADSVPVSTVMRRRNWMGAADASPLPSSAGSVAVSKGAAGVGGDALHSRTPTVTSTESRVSDAGNNKRGGMGSLFRLGGTKGSTSAGAKTPDKGKASPLATPSELPRGVALDYEAASKLLSRLQMASARVGQQQLVIQDLTEKLKTAETVKEFLSKAVAEKEEGLRTALAARDALVAQAGIDREVLSFLDDKSTELERRLYDAERQRDESQRELLMLQEQHASASSAACAARSECEELRLQLRESDQRCEALGASTAATERTVELSTRVEKTDAIIAPSVSAVQVDAMINRIAALERQLEASGTKVCELEAALRLGERERASVTDEMKAALRRVASLEEQLRANAVSESPVLSSSTALPHYPENAAGMAGDAGRIQDLVDEREKLEAKWKVERRTLALEIRRLRDALTAQAAVASPAVGLFSTPSSS